MKISSNTISTLSKIITGDSNISKYRTGKDIIEFFYDFGVRDSFLHGKSRYDYTRDTLQDLNETEEIKRIIEEVVNPLYDNEEKPIYEIAVTLDKCLKKDGYKLVVNKSEHEFLDGSYPTYYEEKCYKVKKINDDNIILSGTTRINSLSHNFIKEQIHKAKNKLASDDYDGVITNIRSMLEAVQEEIIKLRGETVPDHKGDLIKLYKGTKKVLNLEANNKLSDILNQILSGLNNINVGLAGLSNKASDRHARKYKPAKHHAKLAIEIGFAFCEFLISSHEHQMKNPPKK